MDFAALLPSHGIGYSGERDLGGFRKSLPDWPNGAWRTTFRGYADHMRTPSVPGGAGPGARAA